MSDEIVGTGPSLYGGRRVKLLVCPIYRTQFVTEVSRFFERNIRTTPSLCRCTYVKILRVPDLDILDPQVSHSLNRVGFSDGLLEGTRKTSSHP